MYVVVCLPVYLTMWGTHYVCASFCTVSVHNLSVCLLTWPCLCHSECPTARVSVCLSMCPFTHLSVSLHFHPYLSQFIILSICISPHTSVCLYVRNTRSGGGYIAWDTLIHPCKGVYEDWCIPGMWWGYLLETRGRVSMSGVYMIWSRQICYSISVWKRWNIIICSLKE